MVNETGARSFKLVAGDNISLRNVGGAVGVADGGGACGMVNDWERAASRTELEDTDDMEGW